MIRFMLIDKDTHRDDAYEFFTTLDRALDRAERLYHAACDHYNITLQERWNQGCDIKTTSDGRAYYCAWSPCGTFSVTVREVEIP